jgi:hypothetical protein
MATIKFRRGTSFPAGLTAGEPAFRTDTDQFYIHDGVTAIWVGALISTGDISTGSTLTVPTQSAVKTYVDNQVAGGAVTSVSGITGTVGIAAGAAIAITTSGKTLTFSNTGVQSFNGSTGAVTLSNYVASAVAGSNITVSSATGNVTIGVTSTPSFTTITTTGTGSNSIGGSLTVTGNLTVNGTTTTVNSDVMTVDDPMIVIGLSGGIPLSVSDGGKDRGIAFTYYSAAGATGFFGWDASASRFIFTSSATISGDVVSPTPTYAPVQASSFYTLDAISQNTVQITPTNNSTNSSTYTLPDYVSGTFLIPSNEGTANYIIKSNGSGNQPTWINPNASGFTAYAATQLATGRVFSLTGNVTATGITFDGTGNVALSTTIGTGVVTNAMLANSGFTLGTTNITLGSTGLTLAGLSSVTATTFNGALNGNANTATALQTARTFSLTGNVTASGITFDGTGNVALSTTIGSGVVTNAMLVNSGFTLGTTNITLGSTGLTLAGLSSVTATTFNGALNGTATTATNVTLTEATSANTSDLYPTFIASGATGGLLIDATSQAGLVALSYRPSTGVLTAYKVEAIVDGGSY